MIYLGMDSEAGVTFDPNVAESFDGASSFLSTVTVSSVELQDELHRPVPDGSLSAASGTLYPLGLAGPGPAPAPEAILR